MNVEQRIKRKSGGRATWRAGDLFRRLGALLGIPGGALATLFLIPLPWLGILLWSIFVQVPRHGVFALLGLAVGSAIGRLLESSEDLQLGGGIKANALLCAISASWLTSAAGLSWPVQIAIVTAAAAAAGILAAAIERTLIRVGLPPLVAAYCLVAALMFSLFPVWTVSATNTMAPWPGPGGITGWADTFLRSLGSLLYAPGLLAGLVVGIVIVVWSRMMFLTGLLGWIGGVAAAHAFLALGLSYNWMPVSYNFFLSGMALGAVFFLPGRASLLIAGVAGCAAATIALTLQTLLHGASAAYLPITAVLTIWIGIGALARGDGKRALWVNTDMRRPPEEIWWRTAYWSRRFGEGEPLLIVPVAGPVVVSQGFAGKLSHAGRWRYALDFERPGAGETDADHPISIWGAPVVAPAGGIVRHIKADIADNPAGISNFAESWGNCVVIELDQGNGSALLAHLRQGAVAVAPGQRVEVGGYLGEAGNSGRSPVSHLHLQVQRGTWPGAPTVPFRLANYQSAVEPDGKLFRWNATGVPAEGAVVMASMPNPSVHRVLASMAPGNTVWSVKEEGRVPRAFRRRSSRRTERILVCLDEAGHHVFRAPSRGDLVSIMAPDAWRLIAARDVRSPLLKLLGFGVPSVPYAALTDMTWEDVAMAMPVGIMGRIALALAPYRRDPFMQVVSRCISDPDSESGVFEIESRTKTKRRAVPLKVTCRLEAVRGPVWLRAEFAGGSLTFSQLSFEPGLPLGKQI